MSATPESHSARYFALLYASAAQRPVLEALFGIEREVFDSLRAGLDHHVAHSRLQWWREECERAAGGRAVHPLTRELVSALRGAPGLPDAVSGSPAFAAAGSSALAVAGSSTPTAVGSSAFAVSGSPAQAVVVSEPVGAETSSAQVAAKERTVADASSGGTASAASAPLAGESPAHLSSTLSASLAAASLALEESVLPAPSVAEPTAQQRAIALPQLAGLCGIVDVAVWDLAGATFETRRELDAYCERWAAGMIEPLITTAAASASAASTTASTSAATAAGASTSAAAPPSASAAADTPGASATRTAEWRALGAAMREIELLADFAREAHYGRIRVPLDELESANVNINALSKAPWPDAVAQLLRARHKSLRNDIARILANADREEQPALRGLLVWAALAWRSSHRAERALPNRLQPGRFDAVGDAWFAWRIARRATIGRFRLN